MYIYKKYIYIFLGCYIWIQVYIFLSCTTLHICETARDSKDTMFAQHTEDLHNAAEAAGAKVEDAPDSLQLVPNSLQRQLSCYQPSEVMCLRNVPS